ncbi:RecT family protein [Aureimonas altamirensis DSM 21988]|uniref:RecT family protein n=2 Tax=Aureimonas altamirensis TaxID=370622 RepID=A0A0P0YX08_9HYPH|nr:recombinase RecT [Aureimonas altamirensis]BAT26022.1 hypothetical protein [Aureimonas altamirensis]SHI78825.1 RecT family protein [Aureimonas altamirensis DSM 21988]
MSNLALRDPSEVRTPINDVRFASDGGGSHLTPQSLGDIVRFAEVMSRADIAIPKHLRGNAGACLAVTMQAMKWEMDPFSVAQKSYKVGDQMAYEAQLIAAVINTRAGLKRRPQIEYEGQDGDRRCRVTFEALDGSVHVYESPRFSAITTKNSPLWKSDPDQQLGYYSIRAGARRHFPEVILGVYDRDELEGVRDVTPAQPERSSFATRIAKPQESVGPREGFDHGFIDGELGADTMDTSQVPEGDDSRSADPAEEETGPAFDDDTKARLADYARGMLAIVIQEADAGLIKDRLLKSHTRWKGDLAQLSPEAVAVAQQVFKTAQAISKGETDVASAVTHFAYEIGVEEGLIQPEVAG